VGAVLLKLDYHPTTKAGDGKYNTSKTWNAIFTNNMLTKTKYFSATERETVYSPKPKM